MNARPRRSWRRARLAALAVVTSAAVTAQVFVGVPVARAEVGDPCPGGGILSDGPARATFLGTNGGYTSEVSLSSPIEVFVGTGHITSPDTVVELGTFPAGTELIFSIYVRDTGYRYFSGPAERNPDGVIHAAVTTQADGSVVLGFEDLFGGGDRDYDDISIRVEHDDPTVSPCGGPPVSDLDLTVTPAGDRAARTLDLDLDSIGPAARAALLTSPAALEAVQASPLRNSPLRNSPLRNSPLRNSPLRNSPLRNSSLPPILLSSIPLLLDGGWEAILADPSLVPNEILGQPPHAVTLDQLPDTALVGIDLADVDLSATPLRNSSLASTLFGATPLSGLPTAPGTDWCLLLADQPLACPPADAASAAQFLDTTTLLAAEMAGDDLGAWLATEIPLESAALAADSPLATIPLETIELGDTPIGAISFAAAGSLFACPACGAGTTLAELQGPGAADPSGIDPAATVGQLLDLGLPGFSLSLGQLLVGLIPATDMPFEDLPLGDLLDLAPADEYRYAATLAVDCGQDDGLAVEIELPAGFSAVPGSGRYPFSEPDAGTVHVDVPAEACTNVSGALQTLTVDVVAAAPSTRLAPHTAAARAWTAGAPEPLAVSGAELRFVDGAEAEGSADTGIQPDTLYTGHISSAGDVDGFSFPAPPEGSLVTVFLSHLPADYDLVLYGSDAPEAAPLRNSPLRNSPLRNSPLRNSPVEDDGVAEVSAAGDALAPETLQDVPLRNSPLRNSSIQRDLATEVVTTRVLESDDPAGSDDFTVQVSGYNGAFSADPYVLRVKVTPPAGDLECVADRDLDADPGRAGVPGVALPSSLPAGVETLFLVNQERLGDLYGNAPGGSLDWGTAVVERLEDLAQRSDVRGAVLNVGLDAGVAAAYDAWDADRCSVQAANDVVGAVNALVDDYASIRPTLRHIVLVGSDEAVPFARVQDLTTLANQRDYRADAAVGGLDNPISRAFARGFVLTDDAYGDFDPAPWLGGQLYLPDVGLGRLVEHPSEIMASIQRYVDADGNLDVSSSFTAGYDFLADGAAEVDAALRGRGTGGPASRVDESWTRQDVIAAWNAGPTAVSVNAHYDHYRALAANDNASATAAADLLTTADLLASGLPVGALLFSMGCQGGLNLPDVFAAIGDPADAAKVADWAQAAATKLGVLAGNTGYGYGDTDVVAYSERLYANFAEGLDGSVTIGQAMTLAKHRYIGALGLAGVYDAKATQEAVFYGLPMYRLDADGGQGASIVPAASTGAPTGTVQSTAFDVEPSFEVRTSGDGRGSYYVVPGFDAQVTHYRPITPRLEVPVVAIDGLRAHGAVLEEITTRDDDGGGTGVDPVYAMPTRDAAANEPEPRIDTGIFPTTLQNVTRTATATGTVDTLILLPGQFFNTADDGFSGGRGVQRLFDRMAGAVLHSDSDDFAPPAIGDVVAFTVGSSAAFSVAAGDDVGLARVFALYLDDAAPRAGDGSYAWKRVELALGDDGRWIGFGALSPASSEITQWMVQAVDTSGNVGVSTNKGRYFDGGPLPEPPSGLLVSTTPGPRVDGTYPPDVVVAVTVPAGVALERSVDGGEFDDAGAADPVTLRDRGVHTVRYRGSDGSAAEIVLLVAVPDTTAPVFGALDDVTVEASGSSGAVVDFAAPVAGDAVSGSVVGVCSPVSGSTFALGSTPVTCLAADAAGNSASAGFAVVVRDTTAPTVTLTGNAGVYDVDQQVAITCAAADAVTLGLSCPSVVGPAWSFGVGAHSVTRTVADAAGNSTVATTSFTVSVTRDGLIRLTTALVADRGVRNSLTAKLRSESYDAFRNELRAQSGKKISVATATLLTDLSRSLTRSTRKAVSRGRC